VNGVASWQPRDRIQHPAAAAAAAGAAQQDSETE